MPRILAQQRIPSVSYTAPVQSSHNPDKHSIPEPIYDRGRPYNSDCTD
jgi:hypothetical protein